MKNCTGIRCIMQLGKVDPATCPAVGYCQQATPPTTNADCIRAMSDEELAEILEEISNCGKPTTYTIDGFCVDDGRRSKREWLDWLRQEAQDG